MSQAESRMVVQDSRNCKPAKRRSPAELVSDGVPENFRTLWYRQLSEGGQAYVREIVSERVKNPKASLCLIAKILVIEFSIKYHVDTVAAGLEEMVRHAKAAQ